MSDRLAFLKTTDLFAGVSTDALERIAEALEPACLAAGETVFREGEPGDAVYLVVKGRLRLEYHGVELLTRGPAECVGELALVDDGPRSATAVAATAVQLLRCRRASFQAALEADAGLARGVLRVLSRKLREDVAAQVRFVLERERWRRDLERAREIQMGMLPPGDVITHDIAAAGFSQPAEAVGGDYYDVVPLGDGRLALAIADVTGHGFYSGLFVAMAKSCLHTSVASQHGPRQVMAALRRALTFSIEQHQLMSCCYVLLEPRRGRLAYANAGHPYPYHYRADEGWLERLPALDPILGAELGDAVAFAEAERPWASGDLLVLYTDGLTETLSRSAEPFGHERLERIICEHAGEAAPLVRQAILEAVARHGAGVAPRDDLSLVVTRAL